MLMLMLMLMPMLQVTEPCRHTRRTSAGAFHPSKTQATARRPHAPAYCVGTALRHKACDGVRQLLPSFRSLRLHTTPTLYACWEQMLPCRSAPVHDPRWPCQRKGRGEHIPWRRPWMGHEEWRTAGVQRIKRVHGVRYGGKPKRGPVHLCDSTEALQRPISISNQRAICQQLHYQSTIDTGPMPNSSELPHVPKAPEHVYAGTCVGATPRVVGPPADNPFRCRTWKRRRRSHGRPRCWSRLQQPWYRQGSSRPLIQWADLMGSMRHSRRGLVLMEHTGTNVPLSCTVPDPQEDVPGPTLCEGAGPMEGFVGGIHCCRAVGTSCTVCSGIQEGMHVWKLVGR